MEYIEPNIADISGEDINALRASVGWEERSVEKWRDNLLRSSFVYTLWHRDKLVGMGRTIDDGAMCMLYDVVVHSGHQGQGLGRRIVRRLVDEARQRGCISIGLFADEKNAEWLIPFYQSLGFVETGTGMKYQRD